MRSALRAVICSAVPGQPVPEVPVRRLSALMDVPRGPHHRSARSPAAASSVRQLTVGVLDEAAGADPATVWARRIAPAAVPGSVLTSASGRPRPPPIPADRR